MQSATADEVHVRSDVLGGDVFLKPAGRGVVAEVGRGGIVQAAGDRDAGLLSCTLRLLQLGVHDVAVRVQANIAIVRFLSARERGAAGAGVSDELVDGIGARSAEHGHVVHIQLSSVHHPCAADLLEAHSVSDHEDDVFHLLALGLLDLDDIVGLFLAVGVVPAEVVHGVGRKVTVQRIGSGLADCGVPAVHGDGGGAGAGGQRAADCLALSGQQRQEVVRPQDCGDKLSVRVLGLEDVLVSDHI